MSYYVDYKFKNVSKEKLLELNKLAEGALRKFTIILASSEQCVYKILNYFHDELKINDRMIKTLDGLAIESYFDPNANHKYNQIQMKKLLEEGIMNDIAGRWLVIPNMNSEWNAKLAFYFYNEVKSAGALGIIFYSSGRNNFGKILLENTTLKITQYPTRIYNEKKVLEDDEW